MGNTNSTEIFLRWLASIGVIAIVLFLMFGWLRGLYWEMQLKVKRRHK